MWVNTIRIRLGHESQDVTLKMTALCRLIGRHKLQWQRDRRRKAGLPNLQIADAGSIRLILDVVGLADCDSQLWLTDSLPANLR